MERLFFKVFMFLPNFLNTSSEKELAHNLVENLCKELPPAIMDTKRKLLSVNKITRLLENTYQAVEAYQKEKKLGFFKRAIFANSFKWELRTKSYPEDFISLATEGLLVALSKK